MSVVENPWPPVVPHMRDVKGSLVNVLLNAARNDYRHKRRSLPDSNVTSQNSHDTAECKDVNEASHSNVD